MPSPPPSEITIIPFLDVPAAAQAASLRAVDDIFFEASSVKSFADEAARRSFRWLWLARYLAEEPEHAFLARTRGGEIVGYLVGSLDDPAQREAFASLAYFQTFAPQTSRYPAHLHVNVATGCRGGGIGARLIEAFAAHAVRRGAPGMHIVTSGGARNTRFYDRCGFVERARTERHGNGVVMLCRALVD